MNFMSSGNSMGIVKYGPGTYQNIDVMGIATVEGDVKAERVKVVGILQIAGNLSVGEILLQGCVQCKQQIKAKTFMLYVGGNSNVEYLEADQVKIIRKKGEGSVEIKKLKCDSLLAEGLVCNEVIVERAEIKDNCRIGKLFYKDKFSNDSTSIIEETIKRK